MPFTYSPEEREVILASFEKPLGSSEGRAVVDAIEAAVTVFIVFGSRRIPTMLQIRKRLNAVRSRSRIVLANRHYLADDPRTDPSGEAAFRWLQRAAGRPLSLEEVFALPQPALISLADRALRRVNTHPKLHPYAASMARYEGNKPLQRLIEDLIDIWIESDQKWPGGSTKRGGHAGGPFLRFVTVCLVPASHRYPFVLAEKELAHQKLRARFRVSTSARLLRWADAERLRHLDVVRTMMLSILADRIHQQAKEKT